MMPQENTWFGILFLMICLVALNLRDHSPQFVNIFYFVSLTLHYILAFYLSQENAIQIINNWYSTLTNPLMVLYFTRGNHVLFFLESAIQLIFLKFVYSPSIEKVVVQLEAKEYAKLMTQFQSTTLIVCVILVWAFERCFQSSYRDLLNEKKIEINKQKFLINGFSHEFRNLLQNMIGGIQISLKEELSLKAREYIVNTDRCGELLLNLVNNILDTAKAGINELEIHVSPTQMKEALGKTWNICSQMLINRKLSGILKISRNLPSTLILDNYRLMQILLNLVGNSAKFTDSGYVNVTIDWIPNKTVIDDSCFLPEPYNNDEEGAFEKAQNIAESSGDYLISRAEKPSVPSWRQEASNDNNSGVVKISVSDSGCGMKPDDLHQIFNQYSQVTPDISKRKMGSGLGLYVTNLLCEKMGGDIRVFSQEKIGTTLTICFPTEAKSDFEPFVELNLNATKDVDFTAKESPRSSLNSLTQLDEIEHRCRIMLVDDEHFIVNILEEYIQQLKLTIIAKAFNGEGAYQTYYESILKEEPIDVILMDINMPIMNGKEAAKKIREFEREKKIWPVKIIMISANCVESEIVDCLDQNGEIRAIQFLKKPVTLDVLRKALIHG
jgi:signal transduction histidine kinase/CheY-like chemotaxis protein